MRSLRPQDPPRDLITDLLEWALCAFIVTAVLSFCWLVSGWLS